MATENFIITNGAGYIMTSVFKKIEPALFKKSNILLPIYNSMIANYFAPITKATILNKGCAVYPIPAALAKITGCTGFSDFGFDVPLLLERNNRQLTQVQESNDEEEYMCINKICNDNCKSICKGNCKSKRIMIIAQDPKRINVTSQTNLLTLSSPFGIHCIKYRRNPQKGFMTGFINLLFMNPELEYVYITDAYKFYANNGLKHINKQTIGAKNAKQAFIDVLKDEINIIQPDSIITFGVMPSNLIASAYTIKKHIKFDTNGMDITPSNAKTPVRHITINNKNVDVIYHKYPRAQGQTPICNRQIYNNILPYI